ncbi:zinc finger protein 839 isoform X2 [Mus caroli]|uniref:Zinc finger protein 839 isoform X2 n=1 Tax=Mus caroli TaxID=10089 RepID=A0A6P7RRS0_MUSCR|nr:zinc finger protein 839 isoform X2 [Mus caroli]
MAGAEPEPGNVGGSGSTLSGRSHGTVRLAPLDPEQLRRVLEQVTRAQPPPGALPAAAQRLRDGAQQAAQPGAEAPRLLTPQELEAICVKVSGDTKIKERTMHPLATIQLRTVRQSQPPGRSPSKGVCVSSPQQLRVQALGRTESQLQLLRRSPQPPAPRVFVQKMMPDLHPVPLKRAKAHETANGCDIALSPVAASGPRAVAAVPSSLLISSLHTTHTEKSKKSLRVRTRSGRVSRPPRYKARDYKFIKTEDLAEGRLSDSDDYSELSVEEEEEEPPEKPAFFDVEVCALRPKAFKCQTCGKSYIGKGGLSRHCKLNPGHSRLQPGVLLSEKADGGLTVGCTDSKTGGLAGPEPSIAAALCVEEAESAWHTLQNGQPVEVEETLVPEPQKRSTSALLRPEKYLGPKNRNWESQAEVSTASLQESRAVQPEGGPAVPSGLSVSGGAQLREALKQCGREELVELVLPQLAQVVTLYELLLVKVEKSPRAKPFFPAVYKEFEELYGMMKRMCQDYLSSAGAYPQEPLEISNDEATVKKPRTVALPTDVPEYPPSANGCQQEPGPPPALATSKGSDPAASENSLCSEGSCLEMVPASDRNAPPAGLWLMVMASDDFEARNGSADPTLLFQDVSGSALYSQVAEPSRMHPAHESVFSEENIPEHTMDQDSGAVWKSNSVCDMPSSGRRIGSRAGALRGTNQPLLGGQQASPSHVLLAEAAAFPLHNTLPVNILPVACVSKIMPEPVLHPGPGGSLSTDGGPSVGSEAGDISHPLFRMETHDQREPETVAAVGEALAFDISNVCQEVLSQGQEQIFFWTSNGFLLSYPSTVVSQEGDSVIVTDARGSILRIGPPEGVALEAIEAFLTVEAECSQ